MSRSRTPRPTSLLAGIAIVCSAWACSSDSGAGGDTGGTPLDAGTDVDLSVDFAAPDAAGDAGYRSPTAGLACDSADDCTDGEVCAGADPAGGVGGYCTILDCTGHPECDFGLDDDVGVFCCSDFDDFRGCFREEPGSVCGDGTGEQGDSCDRGGQSDCEGDDFFCIDVYDDTFCAGECDPRTPGSCDEGAWCFPTSATTGLCIPAGDTPDGESCAEEPASCEPGSICDGAFGDEPAPASVCSRLCTRTAECLATEWCRVFPGQTAGTCIPAGDAGQGESCAEDRWACEDGLYCLNEGTRVARCTRLCERERDCDDGFFCSFFSDRLGTCNPVGDRETGEACGDDPFACVEGAVCIGAGNGVGYNPDAYCAESCRLNPTTCGDGFFCETFGEQGSFCQPDGEAGPGEPCDGPLDCQAGTVCTYNRLEGEPQAGQCRALCSAAEPCEGDDQWCTGVGDEGGVCLDEGSLAAGDECQDDPFGCPEGSFCGGNTAICLFGCTDDPEACPSGLVCSDEEDEADRFCVPFGEAAVGESCSEPDDCEPGAFCGFLGDDDEGSGVCTTGCGDNDDCPDDFWCLRNAATALCVPAGDAPTGADCDTDRFACAAGSLCAFAESDEAYCARDCTGFATRCADDEVCRWVGSGLSLCLAFGDTPPGGSCADEPESCDAASLCLGAGAEDAFCAAACTFDPEACTGENVCTFYPNGLGLCLPPGFDISNGTL